MVEHLAADFRGLQAPTVGNGGESNGDLAALLPQTRQIDTGPLVPRFHWPHKNKGVGDIAGAVEG